MFGIPRYEITGFWRRRLVLNYKWRGFTHIEGRPLYTYAEEDKNKMGDVVAFPSKEEAEQAIIKFKADKEVLDAEYNAKHYKQGLDVIMELE